MKTNLINGEWEGFYNYPFGTTKHKMETFLNYKDGKISGHGSDDIGQFTWSGKYDEEMYKVNMVKSYGSHDVNYSGNIDENGLWGIWAIGEFKGGFHLWPKKADQKENIAVTEEIKELARLTIDLN